MTVHRKLSDVVSLVIAVGIFGSRDGLIYLADRANNRIQVFRQSGEYVMEKIVRPLCSPEGDPVPDCGGSATFSVGFSPDEAQTWLYVADGGSHVMGMTRLMSHDESADDSEPVACMERCDA